MHKLTKTNSVQGDAINLALIENIFKGFDERRNQYFLGANYTSGNVSKFWYNSEQERNSDFDRFAC